MRQSYFAALPSLILCLPYTQGLAPRICSHAVARRELAVTLATAAMTATWQPAEAQTQVGGIAVLGASGRTGGEIVKYCVATGRAIRACSRSGKFDSYSPLITSITADVTKPETLLTAIEGVETVIFAATAPAFGKPSDVDYIGLTSTAQACIAASVPRLVVISGAGVTKLDSPAYKFLNRFGGRMDAKLDGEAAVREAYRSAQPGVTFTIIRPSGLRDADWAEGLPAKGPTALEINQGDEVAGSISRADLAAVCVECAMSDAAAGKTFEVYDAGTALATSSLSLSGILSDPAARAVARFVTREGAPTPVPVTGCEIRGRSDYASLFAKLR